MTAQDLVLAALAIWAVAVAVFDWRQRRVPNLALLAVLAPAIVVLVWRGRGLLGMPPAESLYGLLIGFGLTLPGYLLRKLGAGDVKFAAVLGLIQGGSAVLLTLLMSGLLLGAMSLLVVSWFGLRAARDLRMPAAVALSGGFLLALGWSRWGSG